MSSGFLFYYGLSKNNYFDMLLHLMHLAKDELDCDAFCVQLLMDNKKEDLVEKLGFMTGDGKLHYYLVNWSIGDHIITPNDVGAILV